MSELSHSPPQPESNELLQFNEKGKPPSSHSVGKSEDVYDPCSELGLFLSQRIRREIEENGSADRWSNKIETNFLKKILPEFKKKFPKSQLRGGALRKMWEKVSYYYEKFQGQKGALCNNKLDLRLMIREHLKSCACHSSHLSPYASAEQLAERIGECIAMVEGRRPDLEQLTKVVWATQKHLLYDLNSINSKDPCTQYDITDKLIVKTLLEVTSKTGAHAVDLESLKKEIVQEFELYEAAGKLSHADQLSSVVSMLLAKKLYHTCVISSAFSWEEKEKIEAFIRYQIALSRSNPTLSADRCRVEIIQRILALYSIAQELPKDLNDEDLRRYVREICISSKEKPPLLPTNKCNQIFFIFVNAEMHLMSENKSFDNLAVLENVLVQAYRITCQLPTLCLRQMDQLELLIWKNLEGDGKVLDQIDSQIYRVIEREIGNVLIDNPSHSFRTVVSMVLHFFKEIQKVDPSLGQLDKKIEVWVLQNDMLVRWIHFDQATPLLALLKNLWDRSHVDKYSVNHVEFVARVLADALKAFPVLYPFRDTLRHRLWILYKYLWYALFTDDRISTYKRFLVWHQTRFRHLHPELSEEQIEEMLRHLSDRSLPLTPFESVS